MSPRAFPLPRTIALRYLWSGRGDRLVSFMARLAILGLIFGVSILVLVLSVLNGFDREMRQSVLGVIPHIIISTDQTMPDSRWEAIGRDLLGPDGILAISPVIEQAGVLANPAGSRGVLVQGLDVAAEAEQSRLGNYTVAGSLQALADTRWGIGLGQSLAEELGLQIGDSVDLFSTSLNINPLAPLPSFRAFELRAVFALGAEQIDQNLVVINRSAARALYRMRSSQTGWRVRLVDELAAPQLAQQLSRELQGEFDVIPWTRQLGAVYDNIRFSRSLISLLLWLLVAVAMFNLVVSLLMIVRDKRGDIAILRTLGATPGKITAVFLWQGALIAGIGGVAGILLGCVGALYVSELAAGLEAILGFKLLNSEVYPINYIPSQLRASDLAQVSGGVLILALLASWYPARRAALLRPAEVLRGS